MGTTSIRSRRREPNPSTYQALTGMSFLLPQWRRCRDPRQIPEWHHLPPELRTPPPPRAGAPRHGAAAGLTQAAMAALAGTSIRHYRRLETVGGSRFSTRLLGDVVRLLALTDTQAEALYRWAQHDPPLRAARQGISPTFRRFLSSLPHGAYVSDRAWDVVAYNRLAAVHWPWVTRPGANAMVEVLGPRSRGRLMYPRYRECWVRPMVAQARMALLAHPEDARLQEVVEIIRQNPLVRAVWDQDHDVRSHSQGDIRPMMMPALTKEGPVDVELFGLAPLDRIGELRVVMAWAFDPSIKEPRV